MCLYISCKSLFEVSTSFNESSIESYEFEEALDPHCFGKLDPDPVKSGAMEGRECSQWRRRG